MPVRFSCPQCLSRLTVSRRFAGKRGKCPNCKARVQVPGVSVGQPEAGQEPDPAGSTVGQELAEESPRADPGSSGNEAAGLRDKVLLSRWIVYVQGALLGITATTFFIFGMAVGTGTGSGAGVGDVPGRCVVSGAVYFDQGQQRRADYGAVVILLPVDATPRTRPPAAGLRPDNFQPINNEAIEVIRGLGGSIVRADQDGNFVTELASRKSYWLLVISRNQRASSDTIGKQTRAEIGTYFLPIEDLVGDRAFLWHKVRISGAKQKMQGVTF